MYSCIGMLNRFLTNLYFCKKKKKNTIIRTSDKWIFAFNYSKVTDKKRLAKISYQGEKYYIIGGIFVLSFSNSILTYNSKIINDLLLDATWHVLPYCVF